MSLIPKKMAKYKFNPITGKMDMVGNTSVNASTLKTYTQEDIDVIGVEQGSYKDGDSIAQGTAYDDVIKSMLQKQVAAVYVRPSAKPASDSVLKEVEWGESGSGAFSVSFERGNAGKCTGVIAGNTGVLVSSIEGGNHCSVNLGNYDLNTIVDSTKIPVNYQFSKLINTAGFYVKFEYGKGEQLYDNMGKVSGEPIAAGDVTTGIQKIEPRYPIFYGAVQTYPTNATQSDAIAALRGLNKVLVNSSLKSVTLNTGTAFVNMLIAMPVTKSIATVIDTVNLNQDITSNYVKILDGIDMPSVITGTPIDVKYKVYVLTGDSPYSVNATHVITLK